MGELIVTEFVSVDGVMEAPGGEEGYKHSGWVFEVGHTDESGEFKMKETMEAEAQLLGRRTYEGFAAAWPGREGEFADRFNTMPKYVVSSTLRDPEWQNTTVIGSDVATDVPRLKQEVDGPILVAGSRTLVHDLLRHRLVDQLNLMVFPLILGSGGHVFPDDLEDKLRLELVEARGVGNGIVVQTYRPA